MKYALMHANTELVVSENKEELLEIQKMYRKKEPSCPLDIVEQPSVRRGHLKRTGGSAVPAVKNRIKVAFDAATYQKLLWLHEAQQRRSQKKCSLCETLREVIEKEYRNRTGFH